MDYVLEAFDRYEREEREDALNVDVLAHFADDFSDEPKKTKFILDSLYYLKKEKVTCKDSRRRRASRRQKAHRNSSYLVRSGYAPARSR